MYKKINRITADIMSIAILLLGVGALSFAWIQEVKANGQADEIGKIYNYNNFGKNNKIIGCINTKTLQTKEPINGTCYHGKNRQNIILPSIEQLKKWEQVFDNQNMIINRFPIVNVESGFNPYAGNKWAYGYVQTLRKYNIAPEIIPQLEWLKYRQESQKQGNCSQWLKHGEVRTLRCLYARHYGARSGYHWYPNKAIKIREYYYNYFNLLNK